MLGERLIADTTLNIPHPYEDGMAEQWIETHKPYWNLGYATEATTAALDYGFSDLGLNRISAKHLARNPSSGRVMEKVGMLLEGTARQDTMKWGNYEDLVSYGILREDWRGWK